MNTVLELQRVLLIVLSIGTVHLVKLVNSIIVIIVINCGSICIRYVLICHRICVLCKKSPFIVLRQNSYSQGRIYPQPGPVQKKCGGPMGARRNFCKGATRGLGDGSPLAGSRGGAPVGVWGQSPQKLMEYC